MKSNASGLFAEAIKNSLSGRTKIVGRELLFYESVTSTNTTAMELIGKGCNEGTVVIADEQTGGRGRRGRTWLSPPSENLYLSVILKPEISPEATAVLTLMSAVACAEALKNFSSLPLSLKWPNDLTIADRKIGGILAETRTDPGRVTAVVIGIGININQDISALPPGIREIATSLKNETGVAWSRTDIAVEILHGMDKWYSILIETGKKAVIEACLDLSSTIGRTVSVTTDNNIFTGIAENINNEGRLLVRSSNGTLTEINSGDVTHLR